MHEQDSNKVCVVDYGTSEGFLSKKVSFQCVFAIDCVASTWWLVLE